MSSTSFRISAENLSSPVGWASAYVVFYEQIRKRSVFCYHFAIASSIAFLTVSTAGHLFILLFFFQLSFFFWIKPGLFLLFLFAFIFFSFIVHIFFSFIENDLSGISHLWNDRWRVFMLTNILVFALQCICTYVVSFYKNGRFFYFRGANICTKTIISFMEISSLKNFNHHKPLLARKLGLFVNLSSSFGTLVAQILPVEIGEDGIGSARLESQLQGERLENIEK